MLQTIWVKFEEWLLPRSRALLLGLLTANVCVGLWLNATYEQTPVEPVKLAKLGPEIQLLRDVPAVVPMPKPPPRECRLWGPESDPDAFAELVAQLDSTGGFPEVKRTEVQGAPDYLVYVGELGSREKAKRVARELAGLSIDSYMLARDDTPPIVSVGVFSRKSLAEKQRGKVAALGYEAFIEEMGRAQTVYNLAAHVSVESDLYKSSTSSCMAFAQNS